MFKSIVLVAVALGTLTACQPDKRPNLGRMLGLEGKNGSDGTSGVAGQRGSTGATGSQGATGNAGANGTDGHSCTVTQLSDGASIQCPDGSSAIITNGKDGKAAKTNNSNEND